MRRALALLGILALTATTDARAQTIRTPRRDTILAGTTVTAAFTVSNPTGDIVQLSPRVLPPANWTVLMGTTSMALAPSSSQILMVSVVVPSRAPAGIYAIRVHATNTVSDSLMVRVAPRRAIEMTLVDRPAYVVSGKAYDASFLVRNRGNVPATLRLAARSTLGRASLGESIARLDPEAATVIRARVATHAGLSAASDDVLELTATAAGDTASTVTSARVMIVPEPSRKIDDFLRIPTQVNLRAVSSDAVSPFEVFGTGAVRDGGEARLDFLFRGPTGAYSAFGERDEYRFALEAPSWRVRGGDHLFMLSPLTGGAQPGFGLGVDGTRGAVTAGAYGQQFRRIVEKGGETGGFVMARPRPDARLGVNYVSRAGGVLPGNVGSLVAAFDRQGITAEAELARSSGASRAGFAKLVRLSGSSDAYSYDVGHNSADTTFSGAQRGAQHTYLSANSHYFDNVSFSLNGGTHTTDLSRSTGVPYIDRMDVGTLGATFYSRYTAELGGVSRASTVSGVKRAGRQGSLRLRGDQSTLFASIAVEAEVGRAGDDLLPAATYTDVSVSARRSTSFGGMSLWAERYSGGSITKGAEGTITVGGDGTARLRWMDLSLLGYATRVRRPGANWHSQVDVLASRILPNGDRLSLRARIVGGGALSAADQSVAYLEYGIPLRLPVSRLRTPGRVYGRVVDAITGRGVANALVRLGPQVAITDNAGQVAFGGVPGGEHRLSMSQETSFADAVFVGDPTLTVDSARVQPTTFRLAIARSARVDVVVRRFSTVQTGVGGAADSLADAGPLSNAMLMLVSDSDTLYRTTRDDGKVAFTDIPPGTWTISVRGDAPAFHRFEPDRAELTLAPGESRQLEFRLVPRRREIQIIGDGQELKSEAAPARPQTVPATTRTRKPDENGTETRRPDEQGKAGSRGGQS
ncbi:MAG TPA: NEW3 domain-containing protein [Gemmatimonadaceae bacterium]|nr:NEW3 domain-containing protein [Gemmatimonadaceae bacterium]